MLLGNWGKLPIGWLAADELQISAFPYDSL